MTFQNDFARDGRHNFVRQENQLVEARFLEWSERWVLDGATVMCRDCSGRQRLSESGKTFENEHHLYCKISMLPFQSPFGHLAEILSGWHLEIWDEHGEVN